MKRDLHFILRGLPSPTLYECLVARSIGVLLPSIFFGEGLSKITLSAISSYMTAECPSLSLSWFLDYYCTRYFLDTLIDALKQKGPS